LQDPCASLSDERIKKVSPCKRIPISLKRIRETENYSKRNATCDLHSLPPYAANATSGQLLISIIFSASRASLPIVEGFLRFGKLCIA